MHAQTPRTPKSGQRLTGLLTACATRTTTSPGTRVERCIRMARSRMLAGSPHDAAVCLSGHMLPGSTRQSAFLASHAADSAARLQVSGLAPRSAAQWTGTAVGRADTAGLTTGGARWNRSCILGSTNQAEAGGIAPGQDRNTATMAYARFTPEDPENTHRSGRSERLTLRDRSTTDSQIIDLFRVAQGRRSLCVI